MNRIELQEALKEIDERLEAMDDGLIVIRAEVGRGLSEAFMAAKPRRGALHDVLYGGGFLDLPVVGSARLEDVLADVAEVMGAIV